MGTLRSFRLPDIGEGLTDAVGAPPGVPVELRNAILRLLDGLDEKQWRTKKGAVELLGAMRRPRPALPAPPPAAPSGGEADADALTWRLVAQLSLDHLSLAEAGAGRFQLRLMGIFGLVWAADAMQVIAVGFAVSFVCAWIVVKTFLGYVQRHGFSLFAWWRVVVGAAGLIALALGK